MGAAVTLDTLTTPGIASLVGLVAAVVAFARLYIHSRRTIIFDAWADFAPDEGASDRGKSFADLLLFQIREIQNAHRRSGRELDLRNPYDDIPAFQQELDSRLRAAVELQRSSRFVGPAVGLLMAIVPTRPAHLRGSIHRFGDQLRVNVVLENARGSAGTPQWAGIRTTHGDDDAPDLVKDLAYAIYLTLARSVAFSHPQAFRHYTEALSAHLAFGERGESAARECAERGYEAALEIEARNPAVLYNLGVLHYYRFEHDHNERAEECLRTAMAAADGALRAQIHSGLANVFSMKYGRFKSGEVADLDKAIYHADEALRIDDRLDVVLKAAGLAHHVYSEASKDFAIAAAETGRDADTRACQRAAVHHRRQAIAHYRQAIAANPRYFTAHNNLGNLYLGLAQTTADRSARRELLQVAVQLFKETMTIRPSYHHAYDNLGNAYYELALLGDEHLFPHAEGYYRDAFTIEPSYAEARNDLAMLYLTLQGTDSDEARRLHAEALEHAPDAKRRDALERAFQERRESLCSTAPSPPVDADADAEVRRLARRARRQRRLKRVRSGLTAGRSVEASKAWLTNASGHFSPGKRATTTIASWPARRRAAGVAAAGPHAGRTAAARERLGSPAPRP